MLIRKFCFMLLGTCVALPALAGTVAYVDYPTLMNKAPQIKASEALLKKEYAPRLDKIKKQMEKLQALAKKLSTMGPSANPIQRDSMSENYQKARSALNKSEQSYQTGLELRRSQLNGNFQQLLDQDIKKYARAHGIDVVVKNSVLYEAKEVNITAPILERLKAQYRQTRSRASKKR